MKELHELKAFKIHERQAIEELKAEVYLMEHIKTGARVAVISCDDENKVFNIGFKTPPENSKGIPHILEHSVLCGSKKYPSKSTFVELIKGSMNTFLNAMTFPDKTVYPVASCNDSDFKNLMSVYTDAVFRTNIYDKKEIVLQEGWHYQLDSNDSALTYNGVVYNEMKGAFSSPKTLLANEIMRSLLPNTPYSYVSGGAPNAITDLSYEELLSFHSRYYHPSNCYIYLYGNMDATERLNWLDENYLSKYNRVSIDSEIPLESTFNSIVESSFYYPIGDEEPEQDNTFLAYNVVIRNAIDYHELSIALNILNYAILEAPGAVLKQAILDKGIAKLVSGNYNSSIQQPIFSIIAEKSNKQSKECFLNTIMDTLKELVTKGIDKDTLKASINMLEFKYKEADFGTMPKGIVYGFQIYESWLYKDKSPFECLKFNKIFAEFKKRANEGYFENLIEKYILNNSHGSLVQAIPKKGLMAKKEKELKEKLDLYKNSLSKEEIKRLIDNTHKLKKYQELPPKRKDIDAIPVLSMADINPKAQQLCYNVSKNGGTTIVHNDIFTNGIGYLTLSFDIKNIPHELVPYLGILRNVLCYVDTEKYSYSQLSNIINMNTGGISSYVRFYSNSSEKDGFKVAFEMNIKVLYEKLDFAFEIMEETIRTSRTDNGKRLYEIVSDIKSQLQSWIQSSGNAAAVLRSLSYSSAVSYYEEMVSGLSFYHFIEDIERNFDSRKELIAKKLKELMKYVFRSSKMTVSYTAEKKGHKDLVEKVTRFKGKLYNDDIKEETFKFIPKRLNEGFKISSAVQYVAQSGNYSNEISYTGSLRVLKVLLLYNYLWLNVREKGGAYGCMLNFQRNGNIYVVSYRDPNLLRTYDVYKHIPEFLNNLIIDEKDFVRYIIGAIKELDMPMTPYNKGSYFFKCYMSGITAEDIQKERNEILQTTYEKLVSLAPIMEDFLMQQNICTIGNEESIELEKQIFDTVKQLFS